MGIKDSREFVSSISETMYTSKELIEAAKSSRQILRALIANNIIKPKKGKTENLGNREIMLFDAYDLLTLRVVGTLADMGKTVYSKSEHSDETVVEIFQKNDNDTYKVIDQSNQSIIDEISKLVQRLDYFEMAQNFDIPGYDEKQVGYRDIYTGNSFSDKMVEFLSPIIKPLKEDRNFDENNYTDEFKRCVIFNAKDFYNNLMKLLAVLESDEHFIKNINGFSSDEQINNLKAILKGIIAKWDNDSLTEDYYRVATNFFEKILPDIPKTKISGKKLETLTGSYYQKIIDYFYPTDDIDSNELYKNAYVSSSNLLSSLNIKGNLAKKLDDCGGIGTSQKIKSIAIVIASQRISPYIEKLKNIVKENKNDPVMAIELIADASIKNMVESFKGMLTTDEFMKFVEDLLDMIEQDIKKATKQSDKTFPEGFWQYTREKLMEEAKQTYVSKEGNSDAN